MADQGGISDYAAIAGTRREENDTQNGGYAQLGAALGGKLGGPNSAGGQMAFARGQALGAQTEDALEQAEQRRQANQSDASMAASLRDPSNQTFAFLSPAEREVVAHAAESHQNPEEWMKAIKQHYDNKSAQAMSENPNLTPAQAGAQELAPALAVQKTEGTAGDVFDPTRGQVNAQNQPVPGQGGTTGGSPVTVTPEQHAMNEATLGEKNAQATKALQSGQPMSLAAQDKLAALANHGYVDPAHLPRSLTGASAEGSINAMYAAMFPGAATNGAPAANPNPTGVGQTERAANIRDFTSNSTQSSGGKLTRGIAVSNHLKALDDLAVASQTHDLRLANQAQAALGIATGDPNPANLQLGAHLVGTELSQFILATGGGEKEREQFADPFGNSNSAAMIHGATSTARGFMGGQFDALRSKWESHGNPEPFEQKFLSGSPEASRVLAQFDQSNGREPAPTPAARKPAPSITGGGKQDFSALWSGGTPGAQ